MKISDFGLSAIFETQRSSVSIVGTPLYQSPQVLMRQMYDDKVDTWALGCMLFELLTGGTPFHGTSIRKVLERIQQGRYQLSCQSEPVYIETCLFLLECLQMHENHRIDVKGLLSAPFVAQEFALYQLHGLDKSCFDYS